MIFVQINLEKISLDAVEFQMFQEKFVTFKVKNLSTFYLPGFKIECYLLTNHATFKVLKGFWITNLH